MNTNQNSPECPPVAVDEINSIPDVECHFQSDKSLIKNYASNEEAEILGDLSTVCLNFASVTANAGGFGSVNRIVAYGKSSKFLLFGLNAQNATPPGPRIFGVKVGTSVQEKELVSEINKLI